jgi:hypothetical protein
MPQVFRHRCVAVLLYVSRADLNLKQSQLPCIYNEKHRLKGNCSNSRLLGGRGLRSVTWSHSTADLAPVSLPVAAKSQQLLTYTGSSSLGLNM